VNEGLSLQERIPRNHCWGCGPDNADGLQLPSYAAGDGAVATWQPRPPFFAGPTHILNGGVIASLIDCHSVCTAIADFYRGEGREIGSAPDIWCATASLNVSYLRPVPLDTPLTMRAHVIARDGRRTTVACVLESNGKECARGEVVAVRVAESWREKSNP
jgi:acyl-coenzyme A thioesterase PaaI-like protein